MTQADANRASEVQARELAYHEKLYSGFAQVHFARPAVRALRRHMAGRILQATGAGPQSRVLSLGCGIGDTELLLARRVSEVVGVDLSPTAVRQAREDAAREGIRNCRFLEGAVEGVRESGFDAVVAIFFLHHLPDGQLAEMPRQVARLLRDDGSFYSLDPSRYRLSGAIGSVLFPSLMRKYQTVDERELDPRRTEALFSVAGFDCRMGYYDFLSSPLAGLLPGWKFGYQAARLADEALVRAPLLNRLGSNFEIIASKRR